VTADRTRKPATAKRGRPRSARKSTHEGTNRKRALEAKDSTKEYVQGEEEENEVENEGPEEEDEESVKSDPKKSYSCPFSIARDGARTLCKWPPNADKRSVMICLMLRKPCSWKDIFEKFVSSISLKELNQKRDTTDTTSAKSEGYTGRGSRIPCPASLQSSPALPHHNFHIYSKMNRHPQGLYSNVNAGNLYVTLEAPSRVNDRGMVTIKEGEILTIPTKERVPGEERKQKLFTLRDCDLDGRMKWQRTYELITLDYINEDRK
jgi:hypothetical protein